MTPHFPPSPRSIRIMYHDSDVRNDNIDWYWYSNVGDRNSGLGLVNDPTGDHSNASRASVDPGVLWDYVLFESYAAGRFFELEKSTTYFVISEIVFTFAEYRKYRVRTG